MPPRQFICVDVPAPFPDVAVHVGQPPRIRFLPADLFGVLLAGVPLALAEPAEQASRLSELVARRQFELALVLLTEQVQLVDTANLPQSRRARMEHYQRLANAAVLYFLLGRNEDAQRALESAWQISTDDHSLLLLHGQLQAAGNEFGEAESTFRSVVQIRESDAAWNQLGLLYARQGRYAEATNAFQQSLRFSARPAFAVELSLAKAEVLGGEVNTALQTLEDAASTLPESTPAARAAIDDVQVAAYSQLANWPAAIAAAERAVQETPDVASRWKVLAALYAANGQQEQALHAQARIAALTPQASR